MCLAHTVLFAKMALQLEVVIVEVVTTREHGNTDGAVQVKRNILMK